MQKINLENIKKVHFIGIGGIGMSGLARLFLHEGKEVSGSDRAPSAITGALEQEGVIFFPSQSAENISSRQGLELVVYTEAMSEDHPEMVAAREMGVPPHLSSDSPSDAESNPKKGVGGVPMMNYFEALAMVANEYYLIAVAGTHGKTTTTAMLIDILEEAGLDPTAIVGSLRAKTKSNFRAGKSKYFVVEACEYRRDFLHLKPDVLVITNIEAEHLDYYKDLTDVQMAFRELAEKVPPDGVFIAEVANPNVTPILTGLSCKVVDYKTYLDLSLSMKIPGLHNRMNAAGGFGA
ncbi:MAG: Mur ligase domain-containing protein, partial [Candidatus Paceibacterota bacterium]